MELGKTSWIWRLLGGLALIILGLLIVLYPGITILLFVEIFGLFLFISGITELAFGLTADGGGVEKSLFILQGIMAIIIGMLAFLLPGITLLMATYLVAAWAIIWGIVEIVAALTTQKEGQISIYGPNAKVGKGVGLIVGVLALLLGIMTLVWPGVTLALIVIMVGSIVILIGILIAFGGFQARGATAT